MFKTLYTNIINIELIIISCILAHIFPYTLLLFSYAVLGPAHYLTQISWLHDRKYFVATSFLAPICFVLTFFLMSSSNFLGAAVMMSFMLSAALFFVMPPRLLWRLLALLVGSLLTWSMILYSPAMLFMVLVLPTVVHVFIFTACFMWIGAIKSRSASGYMALAALMIGAASFLLPLPEYPGAGLQGIGFFRPVVDFLQSVSPLSHVESRQFFGFLAFAYTYHYFNWFSKAEVIRWHDIPRRRLFAIILIYAMALGLYLYNFTYGFFAILFLAQLHVVLEFPLNLRTGGMIAGHYWSRLRSTPATA